jgi:hypothetical protein
MTCLIDIADSEEQHQVLSGTKLEGDHVIHFGRPARQQSLSVKK